MIIRDFQNQMGKVRSSDDTSTLEEEGQISDFKFWRGEKGECSKHKDQRKWREELEDGLALTEPTFGLQNSDNSKGPKVDSQKINFSTTSSLEGPLKDFLDKVEKGLGLLSRENNQGLRKLFQEVSP